MPDEGKKTSYSIFEQLSTEELEKLLAQDFVATNGAEPDIDYIMAIMEVIQKREAEASQSVPVDVDAAWKDFRDNYQGQAPSFETDTLPEPVPSHPNQIDNKAEPKGKSKTFRYIILIAAVIVILCGAASAFGFNVFQAFADWTAETFGFVSSSDHAQSPEEQPVSQTDPYQELRVAVAAETDTLMVPAWAPEGTVLDGKVSVVNRLNGVRIQAAYQTEQGQFTIRIQVYDDAPEKYTGTYEKDGQPVQKYEAGGIIHYIMNNIDNCGVAWTDGNVEGSIQGSLSDADLKKMVDSIYKG